MTNNAVILGFYHHSCRLQSEWSCNFEEGSWCDIRHLEGDFTWTLTDQATPSDETGPNAAYDGRFYVFIEASGQRLNDVAR